MDGLVALGSNLGDRRAHLQAGVDGMAASGLHVVDLSSVWETEPVGMAAPEWFLNAVARIETDLRPEAVLEILRGVELACGRTRVGVNASRTLDLDLLLLGQLKVERDDLTIPHPRMWTRAFVLAPLAEVAPGLVHPVTGRSPSAELAALSRPSRVVRRGCLALPGRPPVYSRLS